MRDIEKENLKQMDEPVPAAYGGKILEVHENDHIYIMNNHRWAYACWKKYFNATHLSRVLLVHIDAHPDAISSDFDQSIIPIGTHEGVEDFTQKYLQYDNFLYPYILEHKDRITLINLCHAEEADYGFDPAFNGDLTFRYHTDPRSFFDDVKAAPTNAVILDIDLDYFVREDDGDAVQSDEYIQDFMRQLFRILPLPPSIITIATSPSCFFIEDFSSDGLRRATHVLSIVKKFLSLQ